MGWFFMIVIVFSQQHELPLLQLPQQLLRHLLALDVRFKKQLIHQLIQNHLDFHQLLHCFHLELFLPHFLHLLIDHRQHL